MRKLPVRKVALAVCSPLVLLVGIELVLRCCGYPTDRFTAILPPRDGLYPNNATINMTWGPIPYVVRTNSLGFRGPEFSRQKSAGVRRIVTIGDSHTDGFCLDNEDTWQVQLETLLNRDGKRAEVVNCARGGLTSIDRELYFLNHFGLPLEPDVVVLTFVTNDISDISGRTEAQLLAFRENVQAASGKLAFTRFLLTRTAIGEVSFGAYLAVRSPGTPVANNAVKAGPERYRIAGWDQHLPNIDNFLHRFALTDGPLLKSSFDAGVQQTLDLYARMLSRFADACRKQKVRLLFVYAAPYPQVYDEQAPRRINDTLRRMCDAQGIEFLDTTNGFRAAARAGTQLYLAPVDFHVGPHGARVFAELLAQRLSR